jgi:hypothetical protein
VKPLLEIFKELGRGDGWKAKSKYLSVYVPPPSFRVQPKSFILSSPPSSATKSLPASVAVEMKSNNERDSQTTHLASSDHPRYVHGAQNSGEPVREVVVRISSRCTDVNLTHAPHMTGSPSGSAVVKGGDFSA